MTKKRTPLTTLTDEEQALHLYLDALFRESSVESPSPESAHHDPEPAVTVTTPASVGPAPKSALSETICCFVLNLRGGRIAVRAEDIDAIAKWSGQVTRLPNAPAHQYGVVSYRGGSTVVVDAGAVLFRQEEGSGEESAALTPVERLAIVGNGRLALLCEEVGQMLTVKAEDITWTQRADRASCVEGIIKSSLCMLVNCDALAELFLGGGTARGGPAFA